MEFRPELMPPALDESLVSRLASLAAEIDCGSPAQVVDKVLAFNREAGTEFGFIDFQGIYGGQDHESWVRNVLAKPYERRVADVTRAELIEMARRIMECDGSEHAINFWLGMLEVNIPNERVSDLIFWPNEYFGDPGYSEELSPEQVIDIALQDRVLPQ